MQVELQTVLAQKQAIQRQEILRSTQLADASVEAEAKVRLRASVLRPFAEHAGIYTTRRCDATRPGIWPSTCSRGLARCWCSPNAAPISPNRRWLVCSNGATCALHPTMGLTVD